MNHQQLVEQGVSLFQELKKAYDATQDSRYQKALTGVASAIQELDYATGQKLNEAIYKGNVSAGSGLAPQFGRLTPRQLKEQQRLKVEADKEARLARMEKMMEEAGMTEELSGTSGENATAAPVEENQDVAVDLLATIREKSPAELNETYDNQKKIAALAQEVADLIGEFPFGGKSLIARLTSIKTAVEAAK